MSKKETINENKNAISTIIQKGENILLPDEKREEAEKTQQDLQSLNAMQFSEKCNDITKRTENLYGK